MIPNHIDHLFADFSLTDFLASTFERLPWRGTLSDPALAARIWAGGVEVEDALVRSGARLDREHVRIVREGHVLARGRLAQDREAPLGEDDIPAVRDALDERYTFAITLGPPRRGLLGALAGLVEGTFGCTSHVVVYVTPPCARGFDLHHDGDDVVVVQLVGEKRWRFGPPRERWPLESGRHPSADDAELTTTNLREGDVLYLPRGTVHAAETAVGSSVHVTFSLELPRAYERDLASCLAALGPLADEEISCGAWDDPGEERALADRLVVELGSRAILPGALAPARRAERGWLARALGGGAP